jgi:hypothetical protein
VLSLGKALRALEPSFMAVVLKFKRESSKVSGGSGIDRYVYEDRVRGMKRSIIFSSVLVRTAAVEVSLLLKKLNIFDGEEDKLENFGV